MGYTEAIARLAEPEAMERIRLSSVKLALGVTSASPDKQQQMAARVLNGHVPGFSRAVLLKLDEAGAIGTMADAEIDAAVVAAFQALNA